MIRVIITQKLEKKIIKQFTNESIKIFELFKTLEETPSKGRQLAVVNGKLLRELKYNTHRFYFIIERNRLMLYDKDSLTQLLIKFIEISKKNDQQKTICELKEILEKLPFGDIL